MAIVLYMVQCLIWETTEMESVENTLREVRRAVELLCQAQEAANKMLSEIHEACTKPKQRSELEPWMEKIASSSADIAAGVHHLASTLEEIPGRTAALIGGEED